MEMNYASRGVGNAGLTTGIIGTSLGALTALGGLGGLGGLFGGRNANDPQGVPVSRYDLEKEQQIAELKSQLALRDANTYGDQKSLELYRYIDGRLQEINATLAAQAVNNQATKDSFQLVEALGIFDADHNVDLDKLRDAVMPRIPDEGVTFDLDVPLLSAIQLRIRRDDINKLYQTIMGV